MFIFLKTAFWSKLVENIVFLLALSRILLSFYIMSTGTGDARRTQSVLSFATQSNASSEQNTGRSNKRLREDSLPTITLEVPSETPAVTQRKEYVERLATKLNGISEKACRYESHKSFLTKCAENNIIPNGLQLKLEPTIGNHDEEFLEMWYKKLDECSIMFINMVKEYCDKTLAKVENDKKATKEALNKVMKKEELQSVIETISRNDEIMKRLLQQGKNKRYNYL